MIITIVFLFIDDYQFCVTKYIHLVHEYRMIICLQDKAFALAMKCMLAIRVSEMDAVVSSLEPELIDTLMKYIYRGFESPAEGSSGHLLAWHEKVFAQGGLGCIIRVMTARKSV